MPITIRQIHPLFVGELSGVDLMKPLTPEEAATIEAGMNEYGVLVMRGQHISDEQQVAFTRNFGELEVADAVTNITKPEDRRLAPVMADISNLDRVFERSAQWPESVRAGAIGDSRATVIPAGFPAVNPVKRRSCRGAPYR
jgi:alpha-ketoglutarate-dependent 2,4-dichlorophenoxyacetate dioxygenase